MSHVLSIVSGYEMLVISSLVRCLREPLVLWYPWRRLNLNAITFLPRNCSTTVALTAAPSTTGAPTVVVLPSFTRRTSLNDASAPSSRSSFSTSIVSPT